MSRLDRARFWFWAAVLAVGIEVVWRLHRIPGCAAVGERIQRVATRQLLRPRP